MDTSGGRDNEEANSHAPNDRVEQLMARYRLEKGAFGQSFEQMSRAMRSPFQRVEGGPPCGETREAVLKCYSSAHTPKPEGATASPLDFVDQLKCDNDVQKYVQCMKGVQSSYYEKLLIAKKVAAEAQRRSAESDGAPMH